MGKTILLIPVPSADPIVGQWREKYDPSALNGIPAHITLLFPFKNLEQISGTEINKLIDAFSRFKKFQFSLEQLNTFPTVVFLAPTPEEMFINLTREVVDLFPEYLPYEGNYNSIIPHLTIGQFKTSEAMRVVKEEITGDIKTKLPIRATANEICLMKEAQGEWSVHIKIPLGNE